SAALELISSTGVNFQFVTKEAGEGERGETIVSQSYDENSVISANTPIQLTVTEPERLADGEIFGLFSYTIPQNPYPLAVRLEALLPSGERQRLITVNYTGGEFTVPYKLPSGAVLILSMLNRELLRETIGE
ncbi:MAG: penicillin-binding protein, partial [Treponema sp.]|nr:penicillin-binding protein [Treponema sp.]